MLIMDANSFPISTYFNNTKQINLLFKFSHYKYTCPYIIFSLVIFLKVFCGMCRNELLDKSLEKSSYKIKGCKIQVDKFYLIYRALFYSYI